MSRYSKIQFICPKCKITGYYWVWSDREAEPYCLCGEQMMEYNTEKKQAFAIAEFSMLSPKEKQASLKKRSHEHTLKTAQDKIHQMNNPNYIP